MPLKLFDGPIGYRSLFTKNERNAMQTSVVAAVVAGVLIALVVVWLRVIKPKQDKKRAQKQAEIEASIRKAEAARSRQIMEQILPVLGSTPMRIEDISTAIEQSSGESLASFEIPKALSWELGRQTRCRITRHAEKGFTLK